MKKNQSISEYLAYHLPFYSVIIFLIFNLVAMFLYPGGTYQNPELNIKCFVNDELKQDGNTRDMIFSIGEILEFVSSIMTLLPGDVILTGTPDGVSKVQPGDEIKIEIETIGTLVNQVK